jgi:hypothetical protein
LDTSQLATGDTWAHTVHITMQFDQNAYNAHPVNYLYNQLATAGLTGARLEFEGDKTICEVLHKALQTTANVAATSPVRLKRLFLALIMQDKDPFMGDFRTQDSVSTLVFHSTILSFE